MTTYIAINRSPVSAVPSSYGLKLFRLREYGASQTWIASQSTVPSCAHTDRLRRIRGEVDIGGLGYG
jgi:hypothetical protein